MEERKGGGRWVGYLERCGLVVIVMNMVVGEGGLGVGRRLFFDMVDVGGGWFVMVVRYSCCY